MADGASGALELRAACACARFHALARTAEAASERGLPPVAGRWRGGVRSAPGSFEPAGGRSLCGESWCRAGVDWISRDLRTDTALHGTNGQLASSSVDGDRCRAACILRAHRDVCIRYGISRRATDGAAEARGLPPGRPSACSSRMPAVLDCWVCMWRWVPHLPYLSELWMWALGVRRAGKRDGGAGSDAESCLVPRAGALCTGRAVCHNRAA